MPTRKIVLTEEDERLIAAQIKAGRGRTASEIISAGLTLMMEAEAAARTKPRR